MRPHGVWLSGSQGGIWIVFEVDLIWNYWFCVKEPGTRKVWVVLTLQTAGTWGYLRALHGQVDQDRSALGPRVALSCWCVGRNNINNWALGSSACNRLWFHELFHLLFQIRQVWLVCSLSFKHVRGHQGNRLICSGASSLWVKELTIKHRWSNCRACISITWESVWQILRSHVRPLDQKLWGYGPTTCF